MARSRRKSVNIGPHETELALAGVAALLLGVALGGLLFGGKSEDKTVSAVTPGLFAELVADSFPETYPRYMRVVFDRRSGEGVVPAEARFFIADSAFAPEFVSAIRDETSGTSPTIDSQTFQARYEEILSHLLSPDTVRCQDYHIGRVQTLRDPDWTSSKVREVVLELNIGC